MGHISRLKNTKISWNINPGLFRCLTPQFMIFFCRLQIFFDITFFSSKYSLRNNISVEKLESKIGPDVWRDLGPNSLQRSPACDMGVWVVRVGTLISKLSVCVAHMKFPQTPVEGKW